MVREIVTLNGCIRKGLVGAGKYSFLCFGIFTETICEAKLCPMIR